MFDILFKGAKIYDGTGCPPYFADVAVKDGKIAAVAKNLCGARRRVDCEGLALAPGFIDAHSHDDAMLDSYPSCYYKLEQGITTDITGACGVTVAPISPLHLKEGMMVASTARQGGMPKKIDRWATFSGYMDSMDIPYGPNIAMQVGHGALRAAAGGFADRPLAPPEMEEMLRLAADAMEAGAVGVSFGLIYPPGIYADESECIELCKVIARYGGTFSIHMRWESDRVVEAVESVIRMAREAGIRGVISHHKASGKKNWGKSVKTLELIDKANAEGVEIFLDQYPYTACSTGLKTMIPAAYHALGAEKLVEMLSCSEGRAELLAAMESVESMEPGGDTARVTAEYVMIGNCPSHPEYASRMVADLARELGVDVMELILDILRDDRLETNAIFFSMDDGDVERIMRHPRTMVGSDGIFSGMGNFAHPRCYGTFPRFFGRYVREKGVVSMEEGIRKMTSMAAAVYGLGGKGLLRTGMDADLVLFDPGTFGDNADFKDFNARCAGLKMVVVNGVVAVEDGVYNGRLSGRLLRK